jgi:epoxyqueuosine reductase
MRGNHRMEATAEEAATPRGRLLAEATRLGFDVVGFARADLPLTDDFARYERFVAAEMQGEMAWLARLPEARRRLDGEHILPGAKTVICLARRYGRADDPPSPIARYARGRDYHNGMRKKLRKLAAMVRKIGAELGVETAARPLCDEEPILERAWAARAGLGFVGKNGLLIAPGIGSFVLLGEVVTTMELPADEPMTERCGSCTRCHDACPTRAFAAPWILDPRRCIAYLTIEHRSAIPEALRADIGDHLFGCDDCQTVCPFNATKRANGPLDPRFAPEPRWDSLRETNGLAKLLALDDDGFVRLREGSPVGRATRIGLARNAAIVLGNRADPAAVPALERAAESHDAPVVREAAAWSLERPPMK